MSPFAAIEGAGKPKKCGQTGAPENLVEFFRILADWAVIAEKAELADVAVKRAKSVPSGDSSRAEGER